MAAATQTSAARAPLPLAGRTPLKGGLGPVSWERQPTRHLVQVPRLGLDLKGTSVLDVFLPPPPVFALDRRSVSSPDDPYGIRAREEGTSSTRHPTPGPVPAEVLVTGGTIIFVRVSLGSKALGGHDAEHAVFGSFPKQTVNVSGALLHLRATRKNRARRS